MAVGYVQHRGGSPRVHYTYFLVLTRGRQKLAVLLPRRGLNYVWMVSVYCKNDFLISMMQERLRCSMGRSTGHVGGLASDPTAHTNDLNLLKASFCLVRSHKASSCPEATCMSPSATGWKPTFSTRRCFCERVHSGVDSDSFKPSGGMCQIFT